MTGRARVLVLDDEPALLDALTEYLEERDFQVSAASDATVALGLIGGGGIDIAIIDVGAHGLRVLREATTRNIPSILISGRPVIHEIGGIGSILRKPFRFDVLIEMIEETLTGYSEPSVS